jgi:hypothetical protein
MDDFDSMALVNLGRMMASVEQACDQFARLDLGGEASLCGNLMKRMAAICEKFGPERDYRPTDVRVAIGQLTGYSEQFIDAVDPPLRAQRPRNTDTRAKLHAISSTLKAVVKIGTETADAARREGL